MENIEVITDESNVSVCRKDITSFVEQKYIDTTTISGSENTISVIKKEYKLVGDDVYIGKTYEDAPQWIRDFINNVVDFSIGKKITELNSVTTSLNSLVEELNIAKNTYTNSIISSADIDERINTAITTLNSSIAQSNANIIDLISTKATPDQAIALSTNVLQTSINNGEINSLIANLQTSISNNTQSLGNNIDTVYAEMNGEFENIAGEFEGTAGAINTLEASVTSVENTLISQSNQITNLSTELNNGTNTWASADSNLENSLRTEITDEGSRVESKFAYNSNVNINGIWKKSGFGLTTNYVSGTGTQNDPYVSEFWIDASRLKFTNSNQTGQVAPFTIDATGTVPEITFNGKVSFTNVTGTSDLVSTANIQNAIANNVTTIDGGKIVTNHVFVNNLNAAGGVVADTITGNVLNGTVVNGGVINGARINGAVIKASYLDLDGELEVLTNYHISVAMYNSNPSLYSDAVYISADNEYRIPSWSTVREANSTTTINTGSTTFNSIIHSYSTANVGNNNKAVRINPQVIVTNNVEIVDITFKTAYLDQFSWWNGPILNTSDSFSITVRILGVACVFTFKPGYWDDSWSPVFYSSGLVVNNNGSTVINVASVLHGNSNVNQNIYINGLLFNVALANNKVSAYTGGNDGGYDIYCSYPSLKITLLSGTYSPANWSNAYSLIQVATSGVTDRGFGRRHAPTGTAYSSKVIRNSSGIMINNMI